MGFGQRITQKTTEPLQLPPHPPLPYNAPIVGHFKMGMHWTLKSTNETITLHPQFYWSDEFDWQSQVISEPIYTLTGAMIIETGTKQAGRPITLVGENVWLDKALLVKLFTLQGNTLSLGVPDGRTFDVLLKKIANVAPLIPYQKADESDDDKYRCDIVMMTV